MTDRETLDRARLLFVGDTQGDMLAREVIAIAERAMQKAVLREEQEKKLADYSNSARQTGPYQYVVATKVGLRPGLGRRVTTAQKELADLRAQRDEFMEMLTQLKDAVLFARAQRRPMGIGQDHSQAPPCVQLQLGAEYGRERDCVGFWINSPEIGQTDADSPSPCHRIALALIRLAYAVAEKVKPRK